MHGGTPMIAGFRRRLQRLIQAQVEGRYTRLARRAGIPTSTMQHYVHSAKHLPGGEHLIRLAEALGVSVDYLATGREVVRPTGLLAHPVVLTHGFTPPLGNATHVAIPVFRCGCPDACPLTEQVPPVAAARSRVILEADLLSMHRDHRLIGLQVDADLQCYEWPEGARLVVDWDARLPQWEAVSLIHSDGRCQLGHLAQTNNRLLFANRVEDTPQLVAGERRILGTIVAVVASL